MDEFIFSKHAIGQMESRNISLQIALAILENPKEIIFEKGLSIYQSVIRIIVNSLKNLTSCSHSI
jgi:hypothetical protein